MADGGIYDQLAGGFCRYSVDSEWTIPHFEKMLYDNAALLELYADAWRATREATFAKTARGIAGWVLSEMRSREGAFSSSLDADSEHEEGKFYVWTPAEVRALLNPDEYVLAARSWGLDGPPNFEQVAWHLRVSVPLEEAAQHVEPMRRQLRRLVEAVVLRVVDRHGQDLVVLLAAVDHGHQADGAGFD